MGTFFQWDPTNLSVHVDAMDKEHQILIGIMNELHERHTAGAGAPELRAVLKKLGDYTTKHFADEERYLESIAYPSLTSHKHIHKELLTKFAGHVANFEKTRKLDDEFFHFLSNWLKAHIRGIDRKYGEYAATKKAG